jgi:hypothetical protein
VQKMESTRNLWKVSKDILIDVLGTQDVYSCGLLSPKKNTPSAQKRVSQNCRNLDI